MKTKDILQQKHTVLSTMSGYTKHQGLTDYTQTDLTLSNILFGLGEKYKDVIDELRKQEYHSTEYNYIKEHRLPVWFVGGTFPIRQTEDVDIITYSNILCIDIDAQDINRKAILDLPYVFAVLKSAGGNGYYVLILVEDGRYTKEYYAYLAKLFKMKFNIDVDEQCKNIGRKRVLSYEPDILQWIKPFDAEIIPWKLKILPDDTNNITKPRMIDYVPVKYSNNSIDITRKAIWKLLNNGYSIDDYSTQNNLYGAWYYTACEFDNFDDGYEMFIKFSTNTTKYNDGIDTIKKKWDNADKSKTNIDDVCKKWCGICKSKYGNEWYKNLS